MLQKTLFALSLLISFIAYSQKKISTDFKYKVTYELTYSLDSTNLENKKSEYVVLFSGNNISSYSSKAKLIGNSVILKGNTAETSRSVITDFQYIILKNFKEDSLTYTLQIVEDFFYYKQKLALFNWKLHEDTKVIKGYNAQKATMTYSGRDYIAWFTLDIPISDGPFKFNGLPGLILEIADTKNHHIFKLHSFEKLEPNVVFNTNFRHYILTTKEKLKEVNQRYRRDPFTYVKNPNIKITPEVHQAYIKQFAELLEQENNRIEKY